MPNFEVDIDLPIRAQNGKAVNSRRWLEGEHKDLTECLLVVRSKWPEAKIIQVREFTADGEANSLVVFE
jgi:hypothetical protein